MQRKKNKTLPVIGNPDLANSAQDSYHLEHPVICKAEFSAYDIIGFLSSSSFQADPFKHRGL